MEGLHMKLYSSMEERITHWLVCRSTTILRISLAAVFLGFGVLKFFPGVSSAEELVMKTLDALTFGMLPAREGVVLVAALECTIGLGLLTKRFLRLALVLLGFQMIGAMSPLVLFPGELFGGPFHAPTLEGQYVLKDVVLISAGLVLGATSRRIHTDPEYDLRHPRLSSKHLDRTRRKKEVTY